MKNRVLVMIATAALLVTAVTSAMAGKYDDAIEVHEKFISAMENYVQDLETAQSADAVVSAFDNYTNVMEELVPQMKEVAAKYPELQPDGQGMPDEVKLPDEFKPLADRAEMVGGKLANAMAKIMPYMKDPAVQAAQQRMAAAMSKMRPAE